jgi:dTDP-4-dehydrorhamnose 3,5-epimerase
MPAVQIIQTRRHADERGWFCETWQRARLAGCGIEADFVQDNHSMSLAPGTLRGIHFQAPPHAQAKLVRCMRGRIFDVAVDLRNGSPTYGRWVSAELSADNGRQLFVPAGYGHGFLTLEPDTEVLYKVDDGYAPETEGGIRWDDPDLAISWPVSHAEVRLSRKDATLPFLAEFASPFGYEGEPIAALTGA